MDDFFSITVGTETLFSFLVICFDNSLPFSKDVFKVSSNVKTPFADPKVISFCLDFNNKRMDAWINGKKKVEINQSPLNFIPDKIYFKYGIYRSFVSRYKNIHGKIPTQIVFYDEVRRGTSIKEVDRSMNPKLKPVD